MLKEERNHVSVEFRVERCAVEAVPVRANRGHHLGEVRRTRGEKVEGCCHGNLALAERSQRARLEFKPLSLPANFGTLRL
jgi:hypothetical protein